MVRARCTDEQLASVIPDPDHGIAAHIFWQPRPLPYAARQVQRARDRALEPEMAVLNMRHVTVLNGQDRMRVLARVRTTMSGHMIRFRTFSCSGSAAKRDADVCQSPQTKTAPSGLTVGRKVSGLQPAIRYPARPGPRGMGAHRSACCACMEGPETACPGTERTGRRQQGSCQAGWRSRCPLTSGTATS